MSPSPPQIYGTAGPVFPTAGTGDSRIVRISRIRKSRLTTCAITKKPVPGLPAHSSRQTAQTIVAARNIITLMRRWNFPTSASAHVASERVTCRASVCGAQDSFRRQNWQLVPNLVNGQPVFVFALKQLEVFAFRAAVLVLLREVFKSPHRKVAGAFEVFLGDKFHDPRPSEHQSNIEQDDPLVHFCRQAEKGFDEAHWAGINFRGRPLALW